MERTNILYKLPKSDTRELNGYRRRGAELTEVAELAENRMSL